MKRLSLALLLVLLLPALASAASLKTLDVKGLDEVVAANKGKAIMLNFFATWCPPCRKEIPDLVKVHEKYADKGVVIIGLSVDEDKNAVPGFLQNLGVNYSAYMADSSVARAFGISSIPFNVFINKKGNVVLAGSGLVEHKDLVEIFDKLLED